MHQKAGLAQLRMRGRQFDGLKESLELMDDGSIFGDAAGENNAALSGRRVHILPVKRIHHVVQDAIASHVFRDGAPTQSTGIEPHH